MKWRLIIDSSESPTGLTLSVLGMDITRDDLIRLVVGMQWREMGYMYVQVKDQDLLDDDGGMVGRLNAKTADAFFAQYPAACDIVDEWLGVR